MTDTAAKRRSMLAFASPIPVPPWEPDGTIDADDRLTILHMYAGAFDAGAGQSGVSRLRRSVLHGILDREEIQTRGGQDIVIIAIALLEFYG